MIVDRLLDKSPKVEFDVAIIGAGPAGLSLALSLADTNKRICVIESGGRSVSTKTQEMNTGKILTPSLREDIKNNRARAFGGTSSFWGGGGCST